MVAAATLVLTGLMSFSKSQAVSAVHSAESGDKSDVPTELKDFDSRCKSVGVLLCEGFDSDAEYASAKWPRAGVYPAADKALRGTMDSKIKASGKASLRFEIPTHSGANGAGFWRQPIEHNFGQGTTFYVQFRQRFSKEMLENKWGKTAWKQAIFHNESATCGPVELTTVNYYSNGFPIMYTDCGQVSLFTNGGNPPTKLEQGDYNCWYGQYSKKDCFYYPADQWVTFYYQVSVGHWGKPDSNINAWVALDGQGYKQWIRMPGFTLKNDHPGNDFDTVTLLPYMTSKDSSIDHPIAYTWYDELIVSEKPIAPPTAVQ